MTFLDEQKRPKVYRVAVASAIAAGGIIQLASAVLGAAQLGLAADGGLVIDRFSARTFARLGVRCDSAGNSGYPRFAD